MKRLLVVSSDSRWRYYLEHGLSRTPDLEVASTETCAAAMQELNARAIDHFGAVLVDGGAPAGRAQEEVDLEVDSFIAALRQTQKSEGRDECGRHSLPVLLWSSYHSEGLSRTASRFESTMLLADDTYETIRAALASVGTKLDKKANYACIELEIGPASFRVRVSVDGKGVIAQISRTSAWRPRLQDLEEKFRTWALWQRNIGQQPRYTDYWSLTFKEAGQQLAAELDYERLGDAIEECLKHVNELRKIHFRFSLLASEVDATFPYTNVPFELLYDPHKHEFVRSLAPVARRISLRNPNRIAAPLPAGRTYSGNLLFIKSDAHGVGNIPGTLFNKQLELSLAPLQSLDKERESAQKARTGAATEELSLSAGTDCLKILKSRLLSVTKPAPEIIHFAGHSVRADDGSVYLILPGRQLGQLRPLAVSAFAFWARKAKVQLILLSSCESSRPDSAFRLAQVGIPAVIGFRWEVQDEEAAYFTGQLHEMLAAKEPLARAFHSAISAVKEEFPGSPTFASPMLVIQDDEWTS